MKRDLAGRANGTIDPWYGCFLYDAMIEYALNFTYPWSVSGSFAGIDVYDLPDALDPKIPLDGNYFFNDAQTVAALHAPTSKQWTDEMDYYLFLGGADNDYNDPSVEPMTFFTELATNASARVFLSSYIQETMTRSSLTAAQKLSSRIPHSVVSRALRGSRRHPGMLMMAALRGLFTRSATGHTSSSKARDTSSPNNNLLTHTPSSGSSSWAATPPVL